MQGGGSWQVSLDQCLGTSGAGSLLGKGLLGFQILSLLVQIHSRLLHTLPLRLEEVRFKAALCVLVFFYCLGHWGLFTIVS